MQDAFALELDLAEILVRLGNLVGKDNPT
jgi:hypothetical protein